MWKRWGNKGQAGDDQSTGDQHSVDAEGSGGSFRSGVHAAAADARHSFTTISRPQEGFMGFMGSRSSHDARMERNVSVAARNLGDGVQKIVMAAKAKQDNNGVWKADLLALLGSSDQKSDIDALLDNSNCERFVLRCVENELPPNLIHCLRLLRVLELQHAADAKEETEQLKPVGETATRKVSRLLCLLCTDPVVGEQLRPHLFGLLALSGASYPPSGIHVAQAASDVIIAFAEFCLTRQLVWFIHDRKMIMHMTDDIKELCGMTEASASAANVPMGLVGAAAEEAGLWAIAMKTIVKFTSFSCRFQSIDLVKDFEAAGGYKVLRYAILNATAGHGKTLIELIPTLACCPVEINDDYDEESEKIATNIKVFEIQEELLSLSNPVLREYRKQNDDELPDLTEEGALPELASFSLQTAIKLRAAQEVDTGDGLGFDLSSELLGITLQLFSDHPDNYDTLEGRQHVLSYYLLAFPCYQEEDLKNTILKTLEFVLTGVGVGEEVTPVNSTVQIFFALCQTLLQGEDALDTETGNKSQLLDVLASDADLMGRTLEKLLQFDQRVAPLMVESGILTTNLNTLLDLVAAYTEKNATDEGVYSMPPTCTPLDKTFTVVCRVLKLLVAHQPVNFSRDSDSSLEEEESTYLHTLLRRAVKELGTDASFAAAGVFEAYMSSFASLDGLRRDMKFVLGILDYLGVLNQQLPHTSVDTSVFEREAVIVSMLRSVLEARSLSRDAFRECGGFDAILRLLLSFNDSYPVREGMDEETFTTCLLKVLQGLIGLLDAAIGSKSRNPIASSEASPLILPVDVVVDSVSSQLSSPSPAAINCSYMRQRGYYLDLAAAMAGTGILGTDHAEKIVDLSLGHMELELKTAGKAPDVQSVRNPDAIRLVLGIAVFMPDSEGGDSLATRLMDDLLCLCEHDRVGSTLSQFASCGICWSLTSPREFAPILFARDHPLRLRLMQLLCRVASFNMSYMDFVGMLRCIAGPILSADDSNGRVRLPVISSSISRKSMEYNQMSERSAESLGRREIENCERLESLCYIARNDDRFPRLRIGGDTINTIAVLMHKTKLEDRLRAVSEEGRLRFLEIESIDASALSPDGLASAGAPAPGSSSGERVWAALANAGFTYSLWLRHEVSPGGASAGNIYILDISSPFLSSSPSQSSAFLSVWYDIQNQRFNVMSSASYRGEPTCFPVSPLVPNIWHHVLITYSPAKRSMMSRKSVFSIFVDGRPLEAEVRIESVNLPPNARVIVGAPNPALAASGIVRGSLPVWELGPTVMLSTVLLDLDATAIFAYGPDFSALLWGDRPQRLSLAATATAMFSMLAETRELGSVASSLRRRDISKIEGSGYTTSGHVGNDSLSSFNLLCCIPPDCVIFAFQARSTVHRLRNESSRGNRRGLTERLVNLARLNFANSSVSTDALVCGKASVIAPLSFADSLRWAGGPFLLIPLVNKADSAGTLALALQLVRLSTHRHQPNLEMMQAGGGYRILAVLLQEKAMADQRSLDQCLAFSIQGFDPRLSVETALPTASSNENDEIVTSAVPSERWVLSDLDAMKHLLLNHQVWDLKRYGPEIPLSLLSALNSLVDQNSVHKAFNARRLHLVEIVRWALHLMIEASELYMANDGGQQSPSPWFCEAPLVVDVSVGGDPGNPFLLECKNLLRRVLTFMLTPGDLEELAEAIVYTFSITGSSVRSGLAGKQKQAKSAQSESDAEGDEKMLPAPAMRLYLVRLLEELIVDGVNEIVTAQSTGGAKKDGNSSVQPHAAGVASPNQPYLSTPGSRGKTTEGTIHPKHQQAQSFLSAFAGFLTPVWFATVLEGCHEEASASAILRLMILMLQGSAAFETAFKAAGSFAPFVLSIPKFSTCPAITLSLLSQMLNVPILHLHFLPTLDPEQLCEVFDAECHDSEPIVHHDPSDPSSGVFALLAECLGRNIQLISTGNDLSERAKNTNMAVFHLLNHRHSVSTAFQDYCCSPAFLEPLSQALCLVYDEKLQQSVALRPKRRTLLADVPKDLTPTERFVGGPIESETGGMGMIRLLRMVLFRTAKSSPCAALVINALFRSFPIHATPQQVEALHLVLVEHCRSVIYDVLQFGDAIALANCVGICSVFLDQLVCGFFNSEAALQSVKSIVGILAVLIKSETPVLQSLGSAEHSVLTLDAAHIARLTCVTALQISRPSGLDESGDEDLQSEVLGVIDSDIENLLLVTSRDRKSDRRIPTGSLPRPSQGSKIYPLWTSTSVARCSPPNPISYPDLKDCENPELTVIAPLMVSLHSFLIASREDVRSLAISVLVAFLQHRASVMSDLLVADVTHDNYTETIDVVNRGGFRALLAAHEAATIADSTSAASSVKRKYAGFFEWFDRSQDQVQLVFDAVHIEAMRLFPQLERATISQQGAVEIEQQSMLTRLTIQGSHDRTILGGLERAELARRCSEKTSDSHSQWKRQGFDDLAFGAMKWKVLLRQLKGSFSLWEGGPRFDDKMKLSPEERLAVFQSDESSNNDECVEVVRRWKLDLSEGHERQRRRLLPNYEFHGLYNLDENVENEASEHPIIEPEARQDVSNGVADSAEFIVDEMEATTALLKDLNLKRTHRDEDEYDEDEEEEEEDLTVATTASSGASVTMQDDADESSEAGKEKVPAEDEANAVKDDENLDHAEGEKEEEELIEDSSSYELILGLLQAGDRPEKCYNVRRCTGLEVTKSLLLWCRDAIYIIDGFEHSGGDGIGGKITRVEREQSSFYISLRPKNFVQREEKTDDERRSFDGKSEPKVQRQISRTRSSAPEPTNEVVYQHRSQRIPFSELYIVYRRRYQLQQSALEFYDVSKNATLIAFDNLKAREEVLSKVLQSKLPNSVFNSSYGTFISYTKFMNNLKSKIVSQWVNGKISNFEFLMHLNSFAGRSFNDLTQYPVIPWVIADYESEEIDLNNPKTYRDLSKPMGAIGEDRAHQFRDRYEALASACFSDDDPPPFHYGTHYSCAAYVLYYLMRLEPFSRMALALQGGKFDVADRLFHDVGRSWKSASSENLQDVRELIPEFFYLPDFLVNTNGFDFGETQRGKSVHDVSLPKWAKGDPKRFVRINRQALESEHVSKNLHHWVDLIFGYKQRGKEAVESLNTFVHVTYEGEIDIDAMTDPIQRASTIAQIQNFGQTPSRLERKPFPQRIVVHSIKENAVDFAALPLLTPLTPPLCIVGAPHRVRLRPTSTDTCRLGLDGQHDHAVGDMCLVKGQLLGVGRLCSMIIPAKKYFRFGGLGNGVSVHTAAISTRYREVNKLLSMHDSLHRAPVVVAKPSLNGDWLVTGCVDSTVRVWRYDGNNLLLRATLCGHDGWPIKCIDVSTECGVIVTGCGQGRVILWDLRTLTFVRKLRHENEGEAVAAVSINHKNGNIITLVGPQLSMFDINGNNLAVHSPFASNQPTCAIATDCPEWMEEGVVAVTGHLSGEVRLWGLDYKLKRFVLRNIVDENPHSSPITCLRVAGTERQDSLLIGDSSGRMSICKTANLDSFSQDELNQVVAELTKGEHACTPIE